MRVARVVPCSGLHARCALGRDTITQHAVIYHVYAQQLRELIVRVRRCRCVSVCVCVQQQKPVQFYHVSCIMSHALAAIAAHASPEHTHTHANDT